MDISIVYNDKTNRITKIINSAISLMNSVQNYFHFTKKTKDMFGGNDINWTDFCKHYQPNDDYEIYITELRFDDCWFSHEEHEFAVITINDWENVFSPPSLKSYLMYQIVQAAINFEADINEDMLLNQNSIAHNSPQGCIFDTCIHKHDIKLGMRAGIICPDCKTQLRRYGVQETPLNAVEKILYFVRQEAIGRPINATTMNNRNVFIVHGHDHALRSDVENLLRKIGLNPIILSEQTHSCRSIMEEIERHGNRASAAVVLFTPDDFGNVKTKEEKNPRARQNVVFEAGYFMGLLGRDKVILVKSGNSIEMPSDLGGILYSESSKLDIARELRDMGLDVDLNKL